MFWFRWKHPIKFAFIVGLCVLCWFSFSPLKQKVHLGLDLQGGLRALVELEPTDQTPNITSDVQDEELQVLQNRLGGLGVSELTFEKVGTNRINIEMPGLKNPEDAIALIREAAVLEMRPLTADQNARAYQDPNYAATGAYADAKKNGPPIITGADMVHAQPSVNQSGQNIVEFTLTQAAGARFYAWTSKNVGKPLPIFLDQKFISGPAIQSPIASQGEITGNFTEDDAVRLATELNAGALKVPTKIIETENVGPTLGAIDLQKSLVAGLVGLGVVLIFMLAFYRMPGFLADLALVVYCFLMLGYVTLIPVVLTLPGIAGFVLSIGMAVDANVLIFERIKEELWAGRTTRAAVQVGFRRAFTTVLDSHVTTIVGAAVLYALGTGTVKGFALTLLVGTVLSLLTAVNITRAFMDFVVDNDIVKSPWWYGVAGASGKFFRNLKWNIIGQRWIWFSFSSAVIVAGLIALVAHHGLRLGLSFTGGSTVDVKFNSSVTESAVHQALTGIQVTTKPNATQQEQQIAADSLASLQPLIKGEESIQLAAKPDDKIPNDRVIISTQSAIADPAPVYSALDKAGLTVDRSQSQITSVGPSLSQEYLNRSLLALVIAMGLQLVYIAFRFGKQLRFGIISDIKLIHDILVMVGIYAFANKPADDAFLAALLTVIGYSVMDSIVIFDRIRENTHVMPDVPYDSMVNTSLLQTMNRSVNTVATVLITLIALYVFGGDTLKNFAFALIVGVTSGAYSSIFIASPLVVMWKDIADRRRGARRAAVIAAGGTAKPAPGSTASTQAQPQRRIAPKAKRPAVAPPRYRRKREDLTNTPGPNGSSVGVLTDGEHAADADSGDAEADES
jgi:SecD/SecF fusion protein